MKSDLKLVSYQVGEEDTLTQPLKKVILTGSKTNLSLQVCKAYGNQDPHIPALE